LKCPFYYAQRVIHVVSIAAAVMEEMSNPKGPRQDRVTSLCAEFMLDVKVRIKFFLAYAGAPMLINDHDRACAHKLLKASSWKKTLGQLSV
jgi:hypothetical protein